MAHSLEGPIPPMERIGDALAEARRARVVGREDELASFASTLDERGRSTSIVVVHGPGGVGKSTLLAMMAVVARDRAVAVAELDARDLDATPAAVGAAVADRVQALAGDGGPAAPDGRSVRGVLFVDTFERLVALEDWFFRTIVPELPRGVLLVLAGRAEPAALLREDPGLRSVSRVMALRNLGSVDAGRYLASEGVPPNLAPRLAAKTYGHPLALSLAVDLHRRGRLDDGPDAVDLERSPDLVQTLLRRLVDDVPSDHHRQALRVMALARRTDQRLVGDVVHASDSSALFDWLRSLSFVETGPDGLAPHDLARDVLVADLRWRDRAAFDALHTRLFRHFVARARAATGMSRQRATADAMHLSRHNPRFAANWDAAALGNGYADRLRPEDVELLVALARRHEGDEAALLVRHWIGRQPDNVVVFRAAGPEPVGFVIHIALHDATDDDLSVDPGARAVWAYARRRRPPRPGEDVTMWTFNIDADAYQEVGTPTWTLGTVVHSQRHFGLSRPSWEFFVYRDPDYWAAPMAFADLDRAPEADYEIGGRRYAVFAKDWRATDFDDWLELMALRLGGHSPDDLLPRTPPPPLLVLDEGSFAEAVKAALRDLHRPDRLATNPLLRSRITAAATGDRAAVLRAAIEQAAASLGGSPRTAPYLRAVDRTFLRPAGTQERVAELLDLPFSTYRRHLGRGVDAVVAALWAREIDPSDG